MNEFETTLIVLRGNSGSGKTTIARELQAYFGRGTLLVSQDVIRRDMLHVKDREGNPAIELIRQTVEYGKGKCRVVILEGILNRSLYGDMIHQLVESFHRRACLYYFDLPFEETVRRHQLREKKHEFGEESLERWWVPSDVLGIDGERLLSEDMSEQSILDSIKNSAQSQERSAGIDTSSM
ncbi:kinase [Halobacillus litoralis]|uniref:kinase n=1 Tax=Halobacillus litoralis TaxID=45668 RepID=UPI001CD45B57|nr:kinase [Halobacillus litoralis]MCA0969195.1 kinase [Halobacillus litoralis]